MKKPILEIVRSPAVDRPTPSYPSGNLPRRVHKIQPLDLIQADIRIVGT